MSPAPDPMTCREVFRRLDDYLDRELSPEEIAAVEAHLAVCEICAGEYRFDGAVLSGIRARLSRMQAPPSLLEKIRRRIEDAEGS